MVILQRVVTVGLLMVFWNLVLKNTAGNSPHLTGLLSYFLIADGIGELTMATRTKFGTLLRRSIKTGQISNYLMKPLSILPAMYAHVWGERSIYNAPAIASIILGLVINPPNHWTRLSLFFVFLVLSMATAFAFNLIEGILTFWVTSPSGIMNCIVHTTRLLSGAIAPLTFFPNKLRNIVELTPFPAMVFAPINSLGILDSPISIAKSFLIAVFWASALNIVLLRLWRKGLRKYEAIGL